MNNHKIEHLGPLGDSRFANCYRCNFAWDHALENIVYCPNCEGCGECMCCPCGKASCEDCAADEEARKAETEEGISPYEHYEAQFLPDKNRRT